MSVKDSACLPGLTQEAPRASLHSGCSITRVHRNVCACVRGNALGPQPAKIYVRA